MSIIGVALARNADTARKVIYSAQCDASLNVGDLVYIDPSTANKVLKATGNTAVNQVIGVVDTKPQATIAEVMLLGVRTGYTGLTVGSKVFLSTSGTVTSTKPSTGHIHVLGFATDTTDVMFIPTGVKVLQS